MADFSLPLAGMLPASMQPLPSFNNPPPGSPQALEQRRKLALAMIREGTNTSPVQHWSQGAARLAQSLLGNYDLGEADSKEARYREDANRQFMTGINEMMPQQQAATPVAAALARPPQPTAMMPGANGEAARPKVSSSPTVMGDDEAVRLGIYDAPAGGAKPPTPPAAAPPSSPPQAAAPGLAPPPQRPISPALISALSNQWMSPAQGQIASGVVSSALSPSKLDYQKLDNGDILALDPSGRSPPRVIYTAPKNPTMVGLDEDKEYYNRDPVKGTLTPLERPGGPSPQPGITLPSGEVLKPPPGINTKEWKKETTKSVSDAQVGKLTEVQAKDLKFVQRMENAEKLLSGKDNNFDHAPLGFGGAYGRTMEGSDWIPGSRVIGGALTGEKYERYKTARDQFLSGVLRDESGAAIGSSEWQRYERDFFPQPGNSKKTIEDKRRARAIAIDGMKKGVGLPMEFLRNPIGYVQATSGEKGAEASPPARPAPKGMDPKAWEYMTPEERDLWK